MKHYKSQGFIYQGGFKFPKKVYWFAISYWSIFLRSVLLFHESCWHTKDSGYQPSEYEKSKRSPFLRVYWFVEWLKALVYYNNYVDQEAGMNNACNQPSILIVICLMLNVLNIIGFCFLKNYFCCSLLHCIRVQAHLQHDVLAQCLNIL